MNINIHLVDINSKMVKAWRDTFEENPEVKIVEGSLLDQQVDAWVTPTNSRGSMDGGLDLVIKNHLGPSIETAVQKAIANRYGGFMPVGHATCVPVAAGRPKFLISTPTMAGSSEDISDTLNVALACAAAFQAIHMQNERQPGSINSIALPGLGAQTGRVPVEICADLMWTGYSLFRRRAFADFADMRGALEQELGQIGAGPNTQTMVTPSTTPTAVPASNTPASPSATPSNKVTKDTDTDFDDFE